MYNKTKYALNLTAAILCIVIGALELIGGVVTLIASIGLSGAATEAGVTSLVIIVLVCSILDICLGVVFVMLGAKGCKKPIKVNDVYPSTKKLDATMIVFFSIMIVLGLFSFVLSSASVFLIISFILALGGLGIKIAAMCLKNSVDDNVVEVGTPTLKREKAVSNSIEEKIAELKHLKELCVITDEQYDLAVEGIIKNVASK